MRPNIIIFMVDQQRADCVGAFGNPVVQTPNIDALASRGVRFDNAWCQHPVCGPSRVSFMTGWYPHVSGHRTLTNLLNHDEPNMLRMLRDAGYKVAMPGHRGDVFAPGVTEASTDVCGYIVPPTHDDLLSAILASKVAHPPEHPLSRAYYFGDQAEGVSVDADEATTRSAIAFLEDGLDERPFAMWINLFYPHPPFMVAEPWYSMHDRSSVPMPLGRDAGFGKPGYQRELRSRYGWDELDDDQLREVIATYYGMVSRTDNQFGRVVDAVERSGKLDSTIFVYLSDHGEYLGDYGLVEKWPSAVDPQIVRDPLVIAGPGIAQGEVCDAMVEIIDVLPTLAEVAETDLGYTQFGRSLTSLLRDPTRSHREFAFTEGGFNPSDSDLFERAGWLYRHKADIQHDLPDLVGKTHAVRNHTHTYVYRQCESDELYDRTADPLETTNLINDPAQSDVVENFRSALLEHLVSTSDVIPWTPDPRMPEIRHGYRAESGDSEASNDVVGPPGG